MADTSNTTNYYNLVRVVLSDKYGVDTYNENLNIIDRALHELAEQIAALTPSSSEG